MARLKQLAGEFAYLDTGGESLALDGGWTSAYLPSEREWLFAYPGAPASSSATVGPGATCRLEPTWSPPSARSTRQVLDAAIDFANANTDGGCFNARFNRVTGNLGFVSRHAWGVALRHEHDDERAGRHTTDEL